MADLASLTVFALLSTMQPGAMPMPRQQASPFRNALLHPPRPAQSAPALQSKPPRDSVKNGTLNGLVIGALTGLYLGKLGCGVSHLFDSKEPDCTAEALLGGLMFGGIGAGIGAGVDALFERAPSPAGAPAGLRKGVRVRFYFGGK